MLSLKSIRIAPRPFVLCAIFFSSFALLLDHTATADELIPTRLRCEYRENPLGIDATKPRLSWQVESAHRGQRQTAYQILVATDADLLSQGKADLWDTGKVASDQTLFIEYAGKALESRQACYWKVIVWDVAGQNPRASEVATWSMGLLQPSDWTADYISSQDESEIHADPSTLHLPAARQYRKDFDATSPIRRATVYATALGIYELEINGQRVGDAMFAPGWTDYRKRAYYNTYDVTDMVTQGDNAIGAWVADGWYSGYVGFGLLTGMGTEKTGRAIYGKTPSVMAQLELEYANGSKQVVNTDSTWKVTGDGPIQEADLLMGEAYDARSEMPGWSSAGFDDGAWQSAVLAQDNQVPTSDFYQYRNPESPGQPVKLLGEPRDLGFQRPELQAFPGDPVRVTETIAAKSVTQRAEGTFVFDLGQNFAGTIRMKVKGEAGQRIQLRYAEMLHPDGRLMTENLRKARATDFYTCKGAPEGEVYEPRFTFHGFQFVELSNYPGQATTETIEGLVIHSDTPMTSTFECSDPMVNRLFQNVLWTQRSNFLDLPTDCPQRDERMGWTGDAQAYIATAAFNSDIGAFYTKWLRELMESQRPSGAFPGYAPFPFQHGMDFGTAWADAGVICPWTIWQAYGDTRVITECWQPMTRFMQWRSETSQDDLGIVHGNAWGDWLAQGAETPIDYIDSIYFAVSARMMAEMADAIGKPQEATLYREQLERTKAAFQAKYVNPDGSMKVRTQTALALALYADLIPASMREATGKHLADMIADNGNRMATGFLGTRPLLPVLSASGQNDLAVFLLQSRDFPSWGYEIANGATTIWERWDSYTKEDAFGRHNAAMNSFSHYAFGAVCEWMFRSLAGIGSSGPGYQRITIKPNPPSPGSNAMRDPVHWVTASYDSIRGRIVSDWKINGDTFRLAVVIPANTTAEIHLPSSSAASMTESGRSLADHPHVQLVRMENDRAVLSVDSGSYDFRSLWASTRQVEPLKTSEPKDFSVNPDEIDISGAEVVQRWDFRSADDVAMWTDRKGIEIQSREANVVLVASADDPQMAVRVKQPAIGRLVIGLKAQPKNTVSSQFFWAPPTTGFTAAQQSKRALKKSDQINEYLFQIRGDQTVTKIRFDPFATFDPYANVGEMQIESITLYRLPQ